MAAVKIPSLSAAVGMKPRSSRGPEPKNNRGDVMLVQKLLQDSGLNVKINGNCDDKFIEVIKKFQKKSLGFKYPDGVIDVGKKTYKKLVMVATKKGGGGQEETGKEQKYREWKHKGTTYLLTEADYKKAVAETARKLIGLVDALQSQHDTLFEIEQAMNKTIQGAEGLMQSVCFFASAKWAGLDVPDFKNQSKSQSAISKARGAVKKQDLKSATSLLPIAQDAVVAYDRELNKYRNKLIGSSEQIVSTLEFTRDTSFTIAEYIGTAILISRKVSPKVAKTSSAAFFAALKSGATEVGVHIADPKKEWGTSAQKIIVDTLVATAISIISNGFKGDSIKKWAGTLAPKIATKPPFKQIGVDASKKYIQKLLEEGGQKLAKDGMQELMKTFGEMTKKGRVPTTKEVEKQIMDYITGQLTGKVLKKFELATWKFSGKLEVAYAEKEAAKLGDWFAKLTKTQRTKILHDIFKKNQEAIIKSGIGGALNKLKGAASEGDIVKQATTKALSDKKLQAMLAKEVAKYQKKGVK